MPEGIEVEVEDGFARIQFADPAKKGEALRALLDVGGPGLIDTDSRAGRRRIYIVPESVARDVGLLDEPSRPKPAEHAALPEGAPSDSWTVAQLTEYARREEIALGGATKKADILAAIRAATE